MIQKRAFQQDMVLQIITIYIVLLILEGKKPRQIRELGRLFRK